MLSEQHQKSTPKEGVIRIQRDKLDWTVTGFCKCPGFPAAFSAKICSFLQLSVNIEMLQFLGKSKISQDQQNSANNLGSSEVPKGTLRKRTLTIYLKLRMKFGGSTNQIPRKIRQPKKPALTREELKGMPKCCNS